MNLLAPQRSTGRIYVIAAAAAARGSGDIVRCSNRAVLRPPHLVFCSVAHDPFEVDVLLFQLIKLGAYRTDSKKLI